MPGTPRAGVRCRAVSGFGHIDLRVADARGASPAKEMPYGPGYHAAFFDDPSGNRLEIYRRPA